MTEDDDVALSESEQWLVEFLSENASREVDDAGLLAANYFEEELLDSLGIVRLIVGIEDRFAVRLEAEHMQDPRFCTIRGLGQILDELRA
jgi:acyl carrier protein